MGPAIFLHPYALIIYALIASHAFAWERGKDFAQDREAARIEATNKRIRAVNDREEAIAAKEASERAAAFGAASVVLARGAKCLVSPEVAAALSAIK